MTFLPAKSASETSFPFASASVKAGAAGIRRAARAGDRRGRGTKRPPRGDRRGGVGTRPRRQPDGPVQHREGGPAASPRDPRKHRERRLHGRHARAGLRGALRGLEGGARQLHALDRARVREPRAARQLPRAGGNHDAHHQELHPAAGLRAVAGRVLLATRAAPDVEARGHGQDDRVPRLGRRAHDHGGDAGGGLGDAGLVAGLLAALERAVAERGAHPLVLHEAPPGVVLGPGDASTLLYTSGTTGTPKGVLFSHGSTGVGGRHFIEALGLTPDDVLLAVTPLFHGNAWGAVQTALHAGGTVAFPQAFHASEFWPLVHRTGATVLYTLGTILAMLLTRAPSALEQTSRLRVILGLGAAPIRDQVMRRFGVAHVAECFGSTDAGVVTITPLGAAWRPGSCGPPVPGVELRILDDEGRALPTRRAGEIAVRSPARLSAYFRDPEATAAALRDGWFLTGDLGFVDEDGWLYFVDRKRDVIRRGGENVSSVLIEKTLREHPRVAEVAVIGVPDPVLGQEIKAFVVAKEPVTAEELRAFAAERLAKFQVPRLWEFRASLPKTATERVEKYKLREEQGGEGPLLG